MKINRTITTYLKRFQINMNKKWDTYTNKFSIIINQCKFSHKVHYNSCLENSFLIYIIKTPKQ